MDRERKEFPSRQMIMLEHIVMAAQLKIYLKDEFQHLIQLKKRDAIYYFMSRKFQQAVFVRLHKIIPDLKKIVINKDSQLVCIFDSNSKIENVYPK